MEELKECVKVEGLWNLFLLYLKDDELGMGLMNFEYVLFVEIMGCVSWVLEVFNCNVLDIGNMELLYMFVMFE